MRVILTGSLPPPVGGVTAFIMYFLSACQQAGGISLTFLSWRALLSKRYDALLINASNPVKRFMFVLLGNLFGQCVIVVKHGGVFRRCDPLLLFRFRGVRGVCCLNAQVLQQVEPFDVAKHLHDTVFRENINGVMEAARSSESILPKSDNRKRILFYANSTVMRGGRHVYGADFLLDTALRFCPEKFEFVVVDLSGEYEARFRALPHNIYYFSSPLSFAQILQEVDVYVRPTRVDGMSVAVLEAGIVGVPAVVSNVVARPRFAVEFELDNADDFVKKVLDQCAADRPVSTVQLESVDKLVSFISTCIDHHASS